MLAPMSSRGKLGLSASYLCRVLSLLCILVPSTIPDNPFQVCPLLRPQLLKIHPIFIGIIPPWTLLFFICLRNYSLGFQWAHAFSILPSKKRCARLGYIVWAKIPLSKIRLFREKRPLGGLSFLPRIPPTYPTIWARVAVSSNAIRKTFQNVCVKTSMWP